jgi:undecaprenyl diphosphate synthase
VRAVQKLAEEVKSGKLKPRDISEDAISKALDTAELPEPDLLIRTGGEQRLSNFLLWQSAYTEFYFTDRLWPDFDAAHFNEALREYASRERRYGTTGA